MGVKLLLPLKLKHVEAPSVFKQFLYGTVLQVSGSNVVLSQQQHVNVKCTLPLVTVSVLPFPSFFQQSQTPAAPSCRGLWQPELPSRLVKLCDLSLGPDRRRVLGVWGLFRLRSGLWPWGELQ